MKKSGLLITLLLIFLPFFFQEHASAFGVQGESLHIDTVKALAINRSMLAQFRADYATLSEIPATSDHAKRELANLQYKIKALSEENEKLIRALSQKDQADDFLKNIIAKTEAERPSSENTTASISASFAPEPTETIVPLKQQRQNFPETSRLHERALEFVAKKELKKAINIYQDIVLTNPNDDEAYLLMGHCFVMTGDFVKAEEAFQNAANINPKDLSQVMPFYDNLVSKNPNDADARADQGFVCLMFGNIERAKDCFNKALSLDSGNVVALRGLKLLESRKLNQ